MTQPTCSWLGSSQDFGHSKTSAQGFLSAAGHRLSFLPGRGSDTAEPYTLYLQLFVQLILRPVTAFKWLQVTFLTCSNQYGQC